MWNGAFHENTFRRAISGAKLRRKKRRAPRFSFASVNIPQCCLTDSKFKVKTYENRRPRHSTSTTFFLVKKEIDDG